MRNTHFLTGAALLAGASLIACDKQQDPVYPSSSASTGYYPSTGTYNQGAGGYQATGGYQASGGYTPTGGAGAGAPATTGAGAGTPGGNLATPLPAALATPLLPALKGSAQVETSGMVEDGTPLAGQFQTGQILEQPITLQPGKCYGVVGLGFGVTELDVEIVVHQPPAPEFVAATDQKTGPQAAIPASACYRNLAPVALQAKLRMRATAGAGAAMAQLYVK